MEEMHELLRCGCVLYNYSKCIVFVHTNAYNVCGGQRSMWGGFILCFFSHEGLCTQGHFTCLLFYVCPQIAHTFFFAIFRDLRKCHSESLSIIKWHLLPLTPYHPSLLYCYSTYQPSHPCLFICSHGNPSHPQNIMVLILYSQCLNQHLPIISFSTY